MALFLINISFLINHLHLFLDNYIIRSEKADAIPKIFVRDMKTNIEQEIKISDEVIGSPSISLMQKNTNTTKIRVGWESLATPGKVYEYDISKPLTTLIQRPSSNFT